MGVEDLLLQELIADRLMLRCFFKDLCLLRACGNFLDDWSNTDDDCGSGGLGLEDESDETSKISLFVGFCVNVL